MVASFYVEALVGEKVRLRFGLAVKLKRTRIDDFWLCNVVGHLSLNSKIQNHLNRNYADCIPKLL